VEDMARENTHSSCIERRAEVRRVIEEFKTRAVDFACDVAASGRRLHVLSGRQLNAEDD
jgi:hypothetical protein